MKTHHAREPEVIKLITSIEKHHAKVHLVCGMAEEHCLKQYGDHVAMGDSCSEMWQEMMPLERNRKAAETARDG